ncbi:ABC transporter permease [Cytophagales bacterium WSM2-2]|nr:ABC transporter permease [Cytophagales bacterium WSM2-2]
MLKNYLKTSFRNLWREKNKTAINILGLTIGVAASLTLFLIIRHHNSFDTYHTNRDRIYRVIVMSDGNNGKDYGNGIPNPLPEAFRSDFAEMDEVTFTSYRAGAMITIPQAAGEPKRYEESRGVTFAQPNFFKIFDRKILTGSAEKGLDDPNEAIISQAFAKKYFGKADAIGEVLEYDNIQYKVAAIMEDTPNNTDFPFEVMLSYITKKKDFESRGWHSIWSDEQCYLTLKEGTTPASVDGKMPGFVKKYLGDDNQANETFGLQPLSSIHFDNRFSNYNYNVVSKSNLITLTAVAIFLIVSACINFINLSTAEAIKRSKEVGIRKTLGSSRRQLIFQFLGEASMVTVFSVGLALILTISTLGFLNAFLDLKLSLQLTDPTIALFIFGLTLIVSVLSGLYPAIVVSGFQPASALKNKISSRNSSGFILRRGLVITQFIISQTLIIGTIVLIAQMKYFSNKDLGFRKDAIITVPVPVSEEPALKDSSKVSRMRTLRSEILRLKGVEMASLNNAAPSSGSVMGTRFTIEGNETSFETQIKAIDSGYVPLYGLKIITGKNILDYDTARGFLVNEKLAAIAGYKNPQDIVGKIIRMWGKRLPVVGVVNDFHTVSLHDQIEPTILLNRIRNYRMLAVKISPSNMQETIKEIQAKWETLYPDFIYSYEFVDESIREFYENEQRTSTLLTVFTSLAIFIGCLGLFGLASFMANQKTKEIGVRKVMGASVQSIILLFSREFVVLIAIGFVIAAPVAWYFSNQWLDQFAYKITVGPIVFVAGLAATFLVAMLTVGYRSFRAASANPVDSLKYE